MSTDGERWRASVRRAASLALASVLISPPPLLAQEGATEGIVTTGEAEASDPAAETPALLREGATREEREASAAALLSEERLAPLRRALVNESGSLGDAASAARAAIARGAGSEAALGLLEEASAGSGSDAAAAAGVFSSWTHREAVRAAVRVMRGAIEEGRSAVAQASAQSLERMTGRRCDARDPSAWLAWWSDAEWLPEAEWRGALAAAHRERWLETRAEREALAERVLELSERLHAELEPDQRAGLLEEMLRSPRREERIGGLRLIERALLNGRAVDPRLAEATALMLGDDSPEIRQLAARSLLRFASGPGSEAAAARLGEERDGATAATLLNLALRGSATAALAEDAEPWLGDAAAGEPAARLILAALERGRSPGEAFESRVRERAARAIETSLSPALIGLLGAVGGPGDHDRLAALLAERLEGAEATAAALALETAPGGLARLAAALDSTPELGPVVAEALSRGAGGLSTYRFLASLEGVPEATRRESLERAWGRLTDEEAVEAASVTAPASLRAALVRSRLDGTSSDTGAGGGNGAGGGPDGESGSESGSENGSENGSTDGDGGTPGAGGGLNGAGGVEGGGVATARDRLASALAAAQLEAGEHAAVFEAIGRISAERQAELGRDIAAEAAERMHAAGSEAPAAAACDPRLWAAAVEALVERSPAAAVWLAEDERVSAHVGTDEASWRVLTAAAEAARARTAREEASEEPAQIEEPPGSAEPGPPPSSGDGS